MEELYRRYEPFDTIRERGQSKSRRYFMALPESEPCTGNTGNKIN